MRIIAEPCGRKVPQCLTPAFVAALADSLPGGAAPMQELVYLAGHAHQLLTTLTPEQATAIVSSCCAAGSLLLQYLSYRRGKGE